MKKNDVVTEVCTRCRRERNVKFLYLKNKGNKKVWRCKARSVCSTMRKRQDQPNPKLRRKVKNFK